MTLHWLRWGLNAATPMENPTGTVGLAGGHTKQAGRKSSRSGFALRSMLRAATAGNGTMVALRAKTWQEVDGFYNAALVNGGQSEGAPGLRPQYNADFYAAYVVDPDGNKIAAVCRGFTRA